jgi:hypothetical protein
MAWVVRGVAAASVLVLAACGGGSDRPGQLSIAPRPELTEPPGEMSARMLITVNQLPVAGEAGDSAAAKRAMGPRWGVIGLSDAGAGVTLNAEFRNALPGTYTVRLLDDSTCRIFTAAADPEDKPEYVDAIDDAPLRLPQIAVDAGGEIKRDYAAGGVTVRDFRDRAVVLMDGSKPVACGAATSAPGMMPPGARPPGAPPPNTRPPGSSTPSGGR